jgi:hypothetical protein
VTAGRRVITANSLMLVCIERVWTGHAHVKFGLINFQAVSRPSEAAETG